MSEQVNILLDRLPPYQADQRLVTRRQDTFDIIRELIKKHNQCTTHYDMIARDHWKGTPRETAKHLYSFLKNQVPYQVEPTLKQTVKTPGAILEERHTFGNDCKHYASYIVGVGDALQRQGYPVKCFYRFASYKPGSRSPAHVFAVFVDHDREIWIDPVPEINGFDSRDIIPAYRIDKIPRMSKNTIGSLYDISGLDNRQMVAAAPHWTQLLERRRAHHPGPVHRGTVHHGMPHGRPHHHLATAPHTVLHPVVSGADWLDQYYRHEHSLGKAKKHKGLHLKIKAPKIKVKIPHIKIQPGKLFAKIALAPARNAFLLLVKINMFDLAVKMQEKTVHNKASLDKLQNEWKKLGGKPSALMNQIHAGVNTYNSLHKAHKVSGMEDDNYYEYNVGGGHMAGPEVAAPPVIAAAAPIIAALTALLKSFGVNTSKAAAAGDDATKKVAEKHNKHKDSTDDAGDTTHDDGTVTQATDNGDGTQTLAIKKIPGPDLDSGKDTPAGAGDDSGGDDTGGDDSGGTKPAKTAADDSGDGGTPGVAAMLANVQAFVTEHKWWFIGGGAAVVALIILPKFLGKKPKRRR